MRRKPIINIKQILALSQKIASDFKPEKIILFGSYAYGQATKDSDVDLLVILPFEGQGLQKSLEILNEVQPEFTVDLLVRTPSDVKQRLEWGDFFLQEIIEKGQVLYESSNN